jgi:hypothetical protein
LKERWLELEDDEKDTWRIWSEWDKKRFERDLRTFEKRKKKKKPKIEEDIASVDGQHVPKKRKMSTDGLSVPKKSKKVE